MEYNKALKLKEEWGNKPCDHPKFEKVYYTGAFLLNYVCTQCGCRFHGCAEAGNQRDKEKETLNSIVIPKLNPPSKILKRLKP